MNSAWFPVHGHGYGNGSDSMETFIFDRTMPYRTGQRMGVSLIRITSCACSRRSSLPMEKHVSSSHHERQNRAAHSIGPKKKCCPLRPKFWWLQHFFMLQTDVQQWFRVNRCHDWCREKWREGNAQPCVYMNTTKNVGYSRMPWRANRVHTQRLSPDP